MYRDRDPSATQRSSLDLSYSIPTPPEIPHNLSYRPHPLIHLFYITPALVVYVGPANARFLSRRSCARAHLRPSHFSNRLQSGVVEHFFIWANQYPIIEIVQCQRSLADYMHVSTMCQCALIPYPIPYFLQARRHRAYHRRRYSVRCYADLVP